MAKRKVSADINSPVVVSPASTVVLSGAGAGGGSGYLPDTITGTTGNTITDTRHTHKITLAHQYLLNIQPNDHHDPVTVGNAGLSILGQQLSVNLATNSGLDITTGLVLKTPSGSLSATSSNYVADAIGHSHAVTAYSDLDAYKGHLAKSDTSGDSKWHKITLTDRLRTSLIDSEALTGLSIAPALDLSLSPGDTKRVKTTSGVRLQADNYVSQTTGWAIGYNGAADFRYIYVDELHAKAFIADLEQALAGGQIISKSVAPLSRDFTAPAEGNTADLWVECFQGFPDAQVFQAGDYVMVRNFSRAGGGLNITNCFGTVSAPYFPSPQSDPPEQRWTFTRLSGTVNGFPAAGYMTASTVVKRGALAIDFGTPGMGYHEVNAIDGLMGENSPYDQNVKWNAHPWYDRLVVTRQGNLKGIFNVAGEYGLYAGTGVTDADKFLRVSNQAIEGHNLPIKLYDGANVTVALSPGTNPSIALGMPIPTGWLSQNGFWAGRHTDGTYRQYIGQVSGGALVRGASWDGQSYNVVGNLIVGPGVGYVVDNALLHLPFDGPLPYETDFHVDLSGHVGQKPTVASGGIIGRPGKFGKAVQLAEGTTNLIGNPTMREPGWWAYAIGAGSITQEYRNDATALGGKVLRATLSGCTSWTHFFRANGETLAPNTTYTVRFRLRASQARSITFWVGRPDPPYSQYLRHGFSATTEWQEFSFTQTTPADTTNGYVYAIEAGSNPPNMWFELDYCQVEAKAYPTPIAEGSMGPGHAWTGTPYASTSTRGQGHLRYGSESLNLAAGTLSMWVRFPMPLPNAALPSYARLWEYGYYSFPVVKQQMTWVLTPSWDGIIFAIYNPETGAIYEGPRIPSTAFGDQQWHHFVVTWQDGALRTYLDGAMRTEVGCTTIKSARAYGWWSIPGHGAGMVSADVDDLLILDRVLTADEVRQLYQSGRPVTVTGSPMSLLLTGPEKGKVEAHTGGIYGWAASGAPAWGFSTENSVPFGSATLDAGDFVIGNVSGQQYLRWDASTGKLTIVGDVSASGTVQVAWPNITDKPAGANRLGSDPPPSSGLWLTGSYMGYYDASVSDWMARIDSSGNTRFGRNVSGSTAMLWQVSSGLLRFYAGGVSYPRMELRANGAVHIEVTNPAQDGKVFLNTDGASFKPGAGIWWGVGNVSKDFTSSYSGDHSHSYSGYTGYGGSDNHTHSYSGYTASAGSHTHNTSIAGRHFVVDGNNCLAVKQ